jgi:Na+-transporting NADH:ubiquinone oxidoreductase subunit NqrC
VFSLKNIKGQQALLLVFVVSLISSTLILITSNSILKNKQFYVAEIDGVILNEAVLSTFTLMEAALARRFYEPPPDGTCLKSQNFDLTEVLVMELILVLILNLIPKQKPLK